MKPEITRIEFANLPGVERPTSTKVNLDLILTSPSLVKYVADTRTTIATTTFLFGELFNKFSMPINKLWGQDNLALNALNSAIDIDAVKFFNGDKVVSRILSIAEDFISLPENSTIDFDVLGDYFELMNELKNPRREYTPEQQKAIDDGKRWAQAYERQQREKNKARRKSRKK